MDILELAARAIAVELRCEAMCMRPTYSGYQFVFRYVTYAIIDSTKYVNSQGSSHFRLVNVDGYFLVFRFIEHVGWEVPFRVEIADPRSIDDAVNRIRADAAELRTSLFDPVNRLER